MTIKLFPLFILFSSSFLYAQELDPILLTTKQENPASKISSSSFVLDQQSIENTGNLRAVEILKQIPGVEISQTGVVGGVASVFIRGSESRHTVIMIDGVKIYDPTTPARTFNMATLNLLDIERVEVLKGSQSVLYGTNAIGGVINLITKKGEGKNRVKAGVGIAKELSIGHTFDFDNGLIYANANYQDSEVASDVDEKNLEDEKINRGMTVTGSFQFDKIDSETTFKLVSDYGDIDGQDANSFPVDNKRGYSKSDSIFLKEGLTYNLNEYEKLHLDISYMTFDRADNTGSGKSEREGSSLNLEARMNKQLEDGSVVFGFATVNDTYKDDSTGEKSIRMNDFFANRTLEWEKYTFEAGGRLTMNDDYGSHLVYAVGVNYELDEQQSLRANYKTGYQAPSAFQQFAQTYGNKDLAAEKSTSFEIGYDYKEKSMQYGGAVFRTEVENFIDFANNSYANVDGATTLGFDSYLNYVLDIHEFGVNLAMYRYDMDNGREPEFRPTESFGLNYTQNVNDVHRYGASFIYRGDRFDYVGDTAVEQKKTLGAFHVVDLNYAYILGDYRFMGFIKNLFDTQYEYAWSYNTQGRGVQINFEYIY